MIFLLSILTLFLGPSSAQRTRFTFGEFQLTFEDDVVSCKGGGPWDETAEAIRAGAEDCLRTIPCDDFETTPFFVGLGNVECDDRQRIAFVGGGAMDFNSDVPLDPVIVEECVRTVLESSGCVSIFATYDERVTSPATFISQRYPDLVTNAEEDGEKTSERLAQKETQDESAVMPFPLTGIAGACTAALAVGVLLAFLVHRRRRKRHRNTIGGETPTKRKHQKELSTTDLDITHDDDHADVERGLSRSDSLGTKGTRQSDLVRMLESQSSTDSLRHDDGQHTPTTAKEADASFESSLEEEEEAIEGEAIEVKYEDTAMVGSYDTRHVETSVDDGFPVILVPEDTSVSEDLNLFHTLQNFQFAPFAPTSNEKVQASAGESCNEESQQDKKDDEKMDKTIIDSPTNVPKLDQIMSDDHTSTSSNDSLLEDLRSENEEMVEIMSEDYASTALMDSDHEFEPDAYWDPDDNSISTADAAGLVAMGTGEFSFQPRKLLQNEATTNEEPTNSAPPRSLSKWLCEAPALCTSSSSSLPSMLDSNHRPAVCQRHKSFDGTS